ncbi:Ankyrin repeat protein 2 [Giardia muris]|uniref:Ankyrin repeat protein 2 n=1 Tax=Giardia muris TaxID=5742 RepID=A0A4Z1T5H1_GIAMU|nr:Ankyrin repeat protein 2 [Giardia muris]|eukprot:TNJ27721.1 Ankyrin repeat protein 2 [Giardia muris]
MEFERSVSDSLESLRDSDESVTEEPPEASDNSLLEQSASGPDSPNLPLEDLIAAFLKEKRSYPKGTTGLMYAAKQGNLSAVSQLVEPEGGRQNCLGQTALMLAAGSGHRDVVAALLQKEEGQADDCGQTASLYALRNGHFSLCAYLFGASEKERENTELPSRRFTAALMNDVEYFAGGNDEGPKVMQWNITALMLAAGCGHVRMLELLLPAEAGLQDAYGYTAFLYSLLNGHTTCASLLARHEHSVVIDPQSVATPLMWTAFLGASVRFDDLLSTAGAQLKEQYVFSCAQKSLTLGRGATALMSAAASGNVEYVRLLSAREQGLATEEGLTALMYAALYGQDACLDSLLSEASRTTSQKFHVQIRDVDIWLDEGSTALMFAAAMGHSKCVERLSTNEGGMQNCAGWTALMFGAERGHERCVKVLVSKELRMTTLEEGSTALMMASNAGHVECVKLLREEAGFQTTGWTGERVRFPPGTTALMFAAHNGFRDIVQILEKSSDLGKVDSYGQAALALALQKRHVELLDLLISEAPVRGISGRTQLEFLSDQSDTDEALYRLLFRKKAAVYIKLATVVRVFVLDRARAVVCPQLILSRYLEVSRLAQMVIQDLPAADVEPAREGLELIWSLVLGESLDPIGELYSALDDHFAAQPSMFIAEEDICMVCQTAFRDAMMSPCNHVVACASCFPLLSMQCPICRKAADDGLILMVS